MNIMDRLFQEISNYKLFSYNFHVKDIISMHMLYVIMGLQ